MRTKPLINSIKFSQYSAYLADAMRNLINNLNNHEMKDKITSYFVVINFYKSVN